MTQGSSLRGYAGNAQTMSEAASVGVMSQSNRHSFLRFNAMKDS
jgi:hypothetical protein